MLLQKALRELDGEIDRLSRIRAIVAGLHTTNSPLDYTLAPTEASAPRAVAATERLPRSVRKTEAAAPLLPVPSVKKMPEPVATTEPRKVRKMRFERSTRTRRPAPAAARALGGTIPVQPVFIASAHVARAAAAARANVEAAAGKNLPLPVAAEGTLDALLRELSYRPSQGA